MSHHPSLTLGSACILGGFYGFMKTGSKPSLIGGLVTGSLYLTSSYLLKENKDGGLQLAVGTSALLMGSMARRALIVRAPVPMAMFSMGALATAYYGKALKEDIYGIE